jgi:hypothetical protein
VTVRVYPTLEDWWRAEDPRLRQYSMTRDFGVWWTDPGQAHPVWRVSWVAGTGEIIAVCATSRHDAGQVRVYGVVERCPLTGRCAPGYWVNRKPCVCRNAVEMLLAGWDAHCGRGLGGLAWLAARCAGLPQRPAPTPGTVI